MSTALLCPGQNSSFLPESKLYHSRHVTFDENQFPFSHSKPPVSTDPPSTCLTVTPPSPVPPVAIAPSTTTPITPALPPVTTSVSSSPSPGMPSLAHSNNSTHSASSIPVDPPPPTRTHHMVTTTQNNIFCPKQLSVTTKHPLVSPSAPTCFSQALKDPRWRKAMADEFTALISHGTWELELNDLHYFLGVEVIPTKQGLFLSQNRYVHDLLTILKMDGAKEVHTPMSASAKLLLDDGSANCDAMEFRSTIGSLQYLSLTRPDLCFAVNCLAQFMHKPTVTHWQHVKRLLRRQTNPVIRGFSDADWGGDLDDRKSTTAYIIFLGDNPINWRTRKQKAVARSSTEAEYRALATAASDIAWIQSLLDELGIQNREPPTLLCDNVGATQLSLNPVMHSRMKHIAIDLHFVHDFVRKGKLRVAHVHTDDQLADLLTKPLARSRFTSLRDKINVADGTSILRGRNKLRGSMSVSVKFIRHPHPRKFSTTAMMKRLETWPGSPHGLSLRKEWTSLFVLIDVLKMARAYGNKQTSSNRVLVICRLRTRLDAQTILMMLFTSFLLAKKRGWHDEDDESGL
ncbi:hypothetical protein SADUNF_Sadunf03G0089900 [Salix dunnii]|uniref:Reverse transcriptase Ty1/copia-type domain-containing protein n=1 Tax=Salix dunnii TaxID=1413687 RepID=A0A835KE61_9ROSI|nr:hypothetical protein SADUNF_Sadunf03G0089900 [Salix dunnii]